jgi:hypothetical protein
LLISILLILFLSNISLNNTSEAKEPTIWDQNYKFKQELILPISTDNPYAKFQPMDFEINFNNPCWGKTSKENSIRIVVWDQKQWYEIESQIYDISFDSTNIIEKCGVVFLIPEFANGKEQYYVFYDDKEKTPADYPDHVSIEDSYYYFEPISGISAEGDYYKIIEDGFIIFGIGQKGKVIYRSFSNNIVKMKPGSKDFGISNSQGSVSFCFSYFNGVEEIDEVSSDQHLVSKHISIDGNLMIEFGIVSESNDKNIRTSVSYKYYYNPGNNKRINVNVKHQVFNEIIVKGITNIDGRYGAIISYQSKSERLEKMRFGDIYPFLHVYSENGEIKEYYINTDPEGSEREWIINYKDDLDLGEKAWISYDEGEKGHGQGILFSKNTNIVTTGFDEKDGIQLTVAEKEFLDAMGAEIDYAAISFGRNSYEKFESHDLVIPAGLTVEYEAEYFTTESEGYMAILEEGNIYQTLVQHRYHRGWDSDLEEEQNIYTLKVIPRFTARLFSYQFTNITGFNLTSIQAELYKNNEYITTGYTQKPIIGAPRIIFPKLSKGEYLIKIIHQKLNNEKNFIGFGKINLSNDSEIDIFCTWPREISVEILDQNDQKIENVEICIYFNDTLITTNLSNKTSENILTFPFKLLEKYTLRGFYKGFEVVNYEIPTFKNKIQHFFEVYDLEVEIKDLFDFSPGVNIKIFLTSAQMFSPTEIYPQEIRPGKYLFEKIPKTFYSLQISYGSYIQVFPIKIPEDGNIVNIKFEALFNLKTSLFDSRGNNLDYIGKYLSVYRAGVKIIDSVTPSETISLPPGEYNIYVYDNDNSIIGFKNVFLSNDKKISIVTGINSIIPYLVSILVIVFLIQTIILFFFRKITLNSFLKLIAINLILLSIVLPWWTLTATNSEINANKTIEMYLTPAVMIESVDYKGLTYLDIGVLPEVFISFLGGLVFILCSGFILISISFIPNILYKRRLTKVLIISSILFLILFVSAFLLGMSMVTELSLGSLQGEGILEVVVPTKETIYMNASWGIGIGFYLSIIAAITVLIGGIIDYLKKKNII